MQKLIYSISDIFDTQTQNGCLFSYGVDGYYIAPYQRGYKWKSESIYDQVPVLLMDLYEAFTVFKTTTNTGQEYYLNYITVKTNSNNVFEVIDGQQRLTTLTLIFNALEHSAFFTTKDNIVRSNKGYLVNYARYEGKDESDNIFNQVLSQLDHDESTDTSIEEQDKYFMVKSMRCIIKFFSLFKENSEAIEFLDFIKNKVKIILNKEDDTTSPEETFANLNSNKVPLTNTYLIKGLLLTKASRYADLGQTKRYKEIMDQRSIMGRTWDEITSWFSKPEVALLFLGVEENGMEKFLEIISLTNDKNSNSILSEFKNLLSNEGIAFRNSYSLFNKYHENIITARDSHDILNKIKHTYWLFKSWYNDNELYNLISFRQAKRKNNDAFRNSSEMLKKESRDSLVRYLKDYVISNLPTKESQFSTAGFDAKEETRNLLLAINIFQTNNEIRKQDKFDFYSYQKEDWSLEHIFPQNHNINKFKVKDDKNWILSQVKNQIKSLSHTEDNKIEIDKLGDIIIEIENGNEINSEDIEFIFDKISNVNSLGNMALLSKGVNSSLSNGFFNTKRIILLQKINRGSFVPKHTIDIFSKMLDIKSEYKFDKSLTTWTQTDIVANKNWIETKAKEIVTKFKNMSNDESRIKLFEA